MLKYAGSGFLAGAFAGSVGEVLAAPMTLIKEPFKSPNLSGPIPVSLIIDDGSPVDPLFYELPGYETPFLVPHEFTRRVADTCDQFNLRGKFTLIPMPSFLGRIDKSLKRVPQEHLEEFLKLIRELIETGYPVVVVTHWQSLYTQGTGLGLEGLASLAERMQKVFGSTIEWVPCFEMARRFASSQA